jgi:hypothetical protein
MLYVVGGIAVSLGKHVFNKHLNYFIFTIYFVNLLFGQISRGCVMSHIAIKRRVALDILSARIEMLLDSKQFYIFPYYKKNLDP